MKHKRKRARTAFIRKKRAMEAKAAKKEAKLQQKAEKQADNARRKEAKVKKPFFTTTKIVIFSVALVVFIGISLAAAFLGGLFNGQDGTDGEFKAAEEFVGEYTDTGKVTFLLVGVDREAHLTDTIMVACYDLDDNEIDIISVPRDTRMYVGRKYQKINAAYGQKNKEGKRLGVDGTSEAVKRLLGISEIDYYIEFNLTAFRDTIDELGGVRFNVPQNMYYVDAEQKPPLRINLKAGEQLLDGDKAEQLIRFRSYKLGDIKRVEVQQQFIKAVAQQHLNSGLITKLPGLYNIIQKNIKTNLELSHIVKYAQIYIKRTEEDSLGKNIRMYNLPGHMNDTEYGGSYWIANLDEIAGLVKGIYGEDSAEPTIHSKDGSSALKDVKIKTSASPKASESPRPTSKPTTTPKTTVSPKPTATPEGPKETETAQPKPAKTPKPTQSGGIKRPSAN